MSAEQPLWQAGQQVISTGLTVSSLIPVDAGGAVVAATTPPAIVSAGLSSGQVLTSPTINGGTISGATINAPTISGGTISAGVVIHGSVEQLQVPIPATSAAVGPAIDILVPQGATITSLEVYTTTAFTGATVSLAVGSTSGDASYVAATAIKGGGIVTLAPVASTAAAAALLSAPALSSLVANVSQGTPTSTGGATLVVNYAIP